MSLEEKRKQYKCGDKFITLDKIPTWEAYAKEKKISGGLGAGGAASDQTYRKEFNEKVSVFQGDITALELDAIVNAANKQLAGGGGVDGAIHSAADRSLLQGECRTLGGCETGDAKITGGYRLPARFVIHTVGPVGEKPGLLKNCYQRSLDVMKENNLSSVAFPCISTGIYGYPNDAAAHVALNTVRKWMESNEDYVKNHVKRIIFCLFMPIDVELYHKLLPVYFPLS